MKTKLMLYGLIAVISLAVTGCESGRSARIKEKSEAYSMYTDSMKKRLSEGIIDLGDNSEAVYIALGKPSAKSTRETPNGTVDVWTYKNFVVAPEMAVKLSNNNPGSRYQAGPMLSKNHRDGPSLSSTKNYGPQPSLNDVPGAATVTLHIDIANNSVVGLRVDE